MKKFLLTLAVLAMAICASAQKNQYFWYQGNLILGNPIAQIDSVTFGTEDTDSILIYLPRTIIKTVHDTVYITIHDTVCPDAIPEGAVNGVFSVAANKKVRFSKGNLQYQASTETWRFAENQYDYVGDANENISPTYDGWIDLFGWGTGNHPTEASEDHDMYRSFSDWGVNVISNGGNTANLWRTLTKLEWLYLFCERNGANQLFALGTVNNTYGLIILPDDWVTPSGLDFTASTSNGLVYQNFYASTYYGMGYASAQYENENGNNFIDNTYDEAQWNIMETAGAIFLPLAGVRYGTSCARGNGNGCYWSSTVFTEYDANHLWFISNAVNPQDDDVTYAGQAVRLVQDVEE